jgi:hypothetical protein
MNDGEARILLIKVGETLLVQDYEVCGRSPRAETTTLDFGDSIFQKRMLSSRSYSFSLSPKLE